MRINGHANLFRYEERGNRTEEQIFHPLNFLSSVFRLVPISSYLAPIFAFPKTYNLSPGTYYTLPLTTLPLTNNRQFLNDFLRLSAGVVPHFDHKDINA